MGGKVFALFSFFVLTIFVLLSACGTSTPVATSLPRQAVASSTSNPTDTPSPTNTPSPTDTSTPAVVSSPTVAPTDTSAPQQAVVPTSLDPCQLISSQEASSLAGASFGEGVAGTILDGGKTCTYGSPTTNIFFVEVVQASDQATADAAKAQFLADLQANLKELTNQGIQVHELANFADGAVTAQIDLNAGGETIQGSMFGFLKGTIFVGFSDVAIGNPGPSSEAMQAEATTVLGRLP